MYSWKEGPYLSRRDSVGVELAGSNFPQNHSTLTFIATTPYFFEYFFHFKILILKYILNHLRCRSKLMLLENILLIKLNHILSLRRSGVYEWIGAGS